METHEFKRIIETHGCVYPRIVQREPTTLPRKTHRLTQDGNRKGLTVSRLFLYELVFSYVFYFNVYARVLSQKGHSITALKRKENQKNGKKVNPMAINVKSIPYLLILILVSALLIIQLMPTLRTEITNATNLTTGESALLGYVPFIIVAGFTLVIVGAFLQRRGTKFADLPARFSRFTTFLTSKRGITLQSGIVVIVSIVISMIVGVNLLNTLSGEITNATAVNGSLEGTLEGTLLTQWVTIIIASILIGILGVFMAGKRYRGRRR